jgi:DNA-binding NarL/FixJ family response regulator
LAAEDWAVQTRIMLVDDHADFRRLMTAMLARHPDLEVVAQAGSLAEARKHAKAVKYDLIGDLRAANPDVAVLVLSASLHPTNLERATEAGADEILDKLASPADIVGAIRRLGTGE